MKMDSRNHIKRERSSSVEILSIDSGSDPCYVPQKQALKKRRVRKPVVKNLEDEDSEELDDEDKPAKVEAYRGSKKAKRTIKIKKDALCAKKCASKRKITKLEQLTAGKKDLDSEETDDGQLVETNDIKKKPKQTAKNKKNTVSKKNVTKFEKVIFGESDQINRKDFSETARVWKDENVVAESVNIPPHIAKNVINLLNHDCTIPFIARYRKEMTEDTTPDKLREIQASYENLKIVQKKVDNILKILKKENVEEKIIVDLLNAKTLPEVELLYAPFKPGSKKTLAEKAKALGLLNIAQQLLGGEKQLSLVNFSCFVKSGVSGISSDDEVLKGIQHIIADMVAKDRIILDFIRNAHELRYVRITSCKSSTAQKEERKAIVEGRENQNFKYENYFDFDISANQIRPHQIMALNRGESQKVLTIKLVVPNNFKLKILDMCQYHFIKCKQLDPGTANFINVCIEDAYNRLLEPHICRQIRSELSKNADKESVAVFCSNLKRLLLTPPVRGKTVLGIDPGFTKGCKLAVVSGTGEVLEVDTIYPHRVKKNQNCMDEAKLKNLVSTYLVEIIAIGNGTACRETETWLCNLINGKVFQPYDVKYCIVNESGASIYSVTKEAEVEMPNLDPNNRSAVSIARRLQDPLLEYVKVEPKHLGVGMYQHDISEAMLKNALDSIVVECVSFVGVDLNVCPEVLLRKISGLTANRAKHIIEWREINGSFVNRQQLLDVKGLGPKSFEQCAGFVKILPQTSLNPCSLFMLDSKINDSKKKSKKPVMSEHNPFDSTVIHPESYDIAEKVLVELNAKPCEVGKQTLIDKVLNYTKFTTVETLAERFRVPKPRMQLIIDAFLLPTEYDIRAEFEVPLFRTNVKKFEELKVGQVLTGRVNNVTHFGAFVDIGVGHNGLLHVSKMKQQVINLGDRVSVKVIKIDATKKQIGLELHM